MRTVLRHLIGYAAGMALFLGLVPIGLVALSRGIDSSFGTAINALPELRFFLALLLVGIGGVYTAGSNAALLFQGRGGPTDGFGIATSPRTRALVTTGLYSQTRNPMVFGTHLIYLAIVVQLGSLGGLIVLAALVSLFIPYLRWAEEARLLADFGEEYRRYAQRTPLLFPWPRRRRGGSDAGHERTGRGHARGVLVLIR
jgi:protein-S-isoprenylcysteine O-methyltransferase Ste14